MAFQHDDSRSDNDEEESESEKEDSDSDVVDERIQKRKGNKQKQPIAVKKPKIDIKIPIASDDVVEDLILSDDD